MLFITILFVGTFAWASSCYIHWSIWITTQLFHGKKWTNRTTTNRNKWFNRSVINVELWGKNWSLSAKSVKVRGVCVLTMCTSTNGAVTREKQLSPWWSLMTWRSWCGCSCHWLWLEQTWTIQNRHMSTAAALGLMKGETCEKSWK